MKNPRNTLLLQHIVAIFAFTKLAPGLCTALEIFSKFMDQTLAGVESAIIWYLDNILTRGRAKEEHMGSL